MVHAGSPLISTGGSRPFSTRSIRGRVTDCPNTSCEQTRTIETVLKSTDFMTPPTKGEMDGHTVDKYVTAPREVAPTILTVPLELLHSALEPAREECVDRVSLDLIEKAERARQRLCPLVASWR